MQMSSQSQNGYINIFRNQTRLLEDDIYRIWSWFALARTFQATSQLGLRSVAMLCTTRKSGRWPGVTWRANKAQDVYTWERAWFRLINSVRLVSRIMLLIFSQGHNLSLILPKLVFWVSRSYRVGVERLMSVIVRPDETSARSKTAASRC